MHKFSARARNCDATWAEQCLGTWATYWCWALQGHTQGGMGLPGLLSPVRRCRVVKQHVLMGIKSEPLYCLFVPHNYFKKCNGPGNLVVKCMFCTYEALGSVSYTTPAKVPFQKIAVEIIHSFQWYIKTHNTSKHCCLLIPLLTSILPIIICTKEWMLYLCSFWILFL